MPKQTQALAIPGVDQEESSYPILSQVIQQGPKDIPIELIIDLRRKHLSASQIAKIVGCSKPNVIQRLHKACIQLEATDRFRKNKGDVLANLQRRISNSITDADLEKAGLLAKATSFGILFDKQQLFEGKSTSIVFYADLIKAKQIVDQEIREAEVVDNMSSNEGKTGI